MRPGVARRDTGVLVRQRNDVAALVGGGHASGLTDAFDWDENTRLRNESRDGDAVRASARSAVHDGLVPRPMIAGADRVKPTETVTRHVKQDADVTRERGESVNHTRLDPPVLREVGPPVWMVAELHAVSGRVLQAHVQDACLAARYASLSPCKEPL